MELSILASFFEKVDFCQKFDIKKINFCSLPEFHQNFTSIPCISKIGKQRRIEYLVGSISDNFAINIVRFNLYIDWKLKYCFHKMKRKD